jgi:hypothetical protein
MIIILMRRCTSVVIRVKTGSWDNSSLCGFFFAKVLVGRVACVKYICLAVYMDVLHLKKRFYLASEFVYIEPCIGEYNAVNERVLWVALSLNTSPD